MTDQKNLIIALVAVAVVASTLFYISPEMNNTDDNLKCLARSTIVARGQDWVNKHVPYSQSKTYDGYRTDCSGFVSMAWMLSKPGLTTYTMNSVSKSINKADLQAGDAIICESSHVVLFAGWSDSTKSHYIAMEEANSQTGTVKRVTPYPYWSTGCYHPIRYNGVC